MAGWLQVLKSRLSHFFPFYAFLWNAVYLKKAGGVILALQAGSSIRSYQMELGSALGRYLIPCESWVKSFQSLASLQSQLKQALCARTHTHTQIISPDLLNVKILFSLPYGMQEASSIRVRNMLRACKGEEARPDTSWKPTCLVTEACCGP